MRLILAIVAALALLTTSGQSQSLLLLGAGSRSAAAGGSSPLLTNLLVYYSQEGAADADAADEHNISCGGSGCDLAESASDTIASTTGRVSNARDYELGDTEYHFIADHADLSGTDGDKTWVVWVQLESLVTGAIVSKWNSGGNQREFYIEYNTTSSTFRCNVSSDGGAGTVTTVSATHFGAAAADGTWYMVSCRHDATANEVTIDVNEDADTPITAAHNSGVFNGTAAFRLGSLASDSLYFDGLIDEVGFWTRELTDAEITWLYNSGNGRSYADIVACVGC